MLLLANRRAIEERTAQAGPIRRDQLPKVLSLLRKIRPPLLVISRDRRSCERDLTEFSRREASSVLVIDQLGELRSEEQAWVYDQVEILRSEHWLLFVASPEEAPAVWARLPDRLTRYIAVLEVAA